MVRKRNSKRLAVYKELIADVDLEISTGQCFSTFQSARLSFCV